MYVYDLPAQFNSELKSSQKRCINDQYGTEIMFHENLLTVSTCLCERRRVCVCVVYGRVVVVSSHCAVLPCTSPRYEFVLMYGWERTIGGVAAEVRSLLSSCPL